MEMYEEKDENEKVIVKYYIPIKRERKWWQFWKKSPLKESEDFICELVENYKEEVFFFDDDIGVIKINGDLNSCYSKQIWIQKSEKNK